MEKGLYVAVSGSMAQERAMDVIANNLANVNTPGFKSDNLLFEAYLQESTDPKADLPTTREIDQGYLSKRMHDSTYMIASQSYVDFSQGNLKPTGNMYDISLSGDGFFSVMTPEGERLTRGGTLSVSAEGELTTTGGNPFLDITGKKITVGRDNFTVDEGGSVFSKTDNRFLGKLRIIDFPDKAVLAKRGKNLFESLAPEQAVESKTAVRQGYIEGSNVNPMAEITRMITAVRTYEAYQKSIQTHDEMDSRLINNVGRA